MNNEHRSSKPTVSIYEAAAAQKRLREEHAASRAAWSFEDWLTIRYEELRLERTADEPSGDLLEDAEAWAQRNVKNERNYSTTMTRARAREAYIAGARSERARESR